MVPSYRSNGVVLTVAVLTGAVLALLWDRGWFSLGEAARIGELKLRVLGFDWLGSLAGRLAGDPLTLSMVLALVVIAIYAVLQFIGAAVDFGSIENKGRPSWQRALATLSGRSASMVAVLRDRTDKVAVSAHFGFGRSSLLGPIKFAQWAFPVVGFIGTVIGVSGAVKKLPGAVRGGQMDERMLNSVLDDLHVAFDTTFVGLAASVIVMIGLYLLESRWDRNELLAASSMSQTSARKPAQTSASEAKAPA